MYNCLSSYESFKTTAFIIQRFKHHYMDIGSQFSKMDAYFESQPYTPQNRSYENRTVLDQRTTLINTFKVRKILKTI